MVPLHIIKLIMFIFSIFGKTLCTLIFEWIPLFQKKMMNDFLDWLNVNFQDLILTYMGFQHQFLCYYVTYYLSLVLFFFPKTLFDY